MKINKKGTCALFFALVFPVASFADVGISFSGNLIIPQCTINNNTDVIVDFKDVEIQTLTAADTAYYNQPVIIPINCPYTQGTPNLILSSSAVHSAAQGAIQTSKYSEGLVVYIYKQNGTTPVVLGTATDISDSITGTGTARTLTLNAGVGRIDTMDKLTPGNFTASATLQIMYK